MPSPLSRYRTVPLVAQDIDGRMAQAKDFRAMPSVAGTYTHAIRQGERLDQLAEQYYGEPTKWWRICDANPQVLSPLALLGNDGVISERFWIVYTESEPSWSLILNRLMETEGVLQAQMADIQQKLLTIYVQDTDMNCIGALKVQGAGDQALFTTAEAVELPGEVADLSLNYTNNGFVDGSEWRALADGTVPESSSWRALRMINERFMVASDSYRTYLLSCHSPDSPRRIAASDSYRTYLLSRQESGFIGFPCTLEQRWYLEITYNETRTTSAALQQVIQSVNPDRARGGEDILTIDGIERIEKIGTQIIIPPDTVR